MIEKWKDRQKPARLRKGRPACRTALLSLAGLMSSAVPALAADEPPAAAPRSVVGLLDCRQVADQAARLACFDAAAQTLEAEIASRELIMTDRATVRETRRRLFGFSLPKLRLFAGDDGEEEQPEEMSNTVDGAWIAGNRLRIRFEDDSIWQQVGSDRPRRIPRKGTPAVIKRAAMGTYFVRLGDEVGLRMIRLE